MSYQVKLPVFEGPMDLLLHLIEKNELDIYNIPIALITQQYLDYLARAEELDLELTSDFLVMASTLLAIKARMLLPKPVVETVEEEEGPDPRAELVEKLLEYKAYKEKANFFREREECQSRYFWREIDEGKLLKEFRPANPVGSLSMNDLMVVLCKVLKKVEERLEFVSISREEITIQDKITGILALLDEPSLGKGLSFYQLLDVPHITKEEVIVTFLALLELIKLGKIYVQQKGMFDDIYIFSMQTVMTERKGVFEDAVVS
ncbi:MAG TPA: segregation/condensation protein A [Peptococcaceae bacterium]|nr:segregation/condensation protein A [Peptococcaceae bacterium]HPZ71425.1 segregation/condensation protein A [Peptococcaceae bacterium]HQD54518.1 segregation/condensation protein A [Peptococcaceae bacterium]